MTRLISNSAIVNNCFITFHDFIVTCIVKTLIIIHHYFKSAHRRLCTTGDVIKTLFTGLHVTDVTAIKYHIMLTGLRALLNQLNSI